MNMKKRIIMIAIALVVLCACSFFIPSISQESYTKEELIELIDECQVIKENAYIMATSARVLGWEDDSSLIKTLKNKWEDADRKEQQYQTELDAILAEEEKIARQEEERQRIIEENKWKTKASEYPEATFIWKYMKDLGWNDYVCAGIMGNLMAEVGGQTLNIRYSLSSPGYYGMCQWSRTYSEVWGAGLETQCDFLRDTIKYEIDTYGFKYQKGFNFNSFLNMTDAQGAALAFAKSYERCASGSYAVRQNNALKAYNYFTN